jgi:signal recognition particle subunit SRP68
MNLSDEPQKVFVPVNTSLLILVKAAQNQNGLRSNDYKRYHQYCTRKLYRLRKSLGFTQYHSKRRGADSVFKFNAQPVSAEIITQNSTADAAKLL